MPWLWLLRFLPWVIAAGVVVGAVYGYGKHERNLGRADVQAKLDAMIAEQTAQRLKDTDAARALELRMQKEKDDAIAQAREAAAVANRDAERATVAARDAGGAIDGLREQLATAIAGLKDRAGTPAPACGGVDAALAASAVLTDLCGSLVERARVVAAFADQAHAAGQACVRQYLSLTCDPGK